MTGVQKTSLSLLVSTVCFGLFALWAYSGLFSILETTFFRQKVESSVNRQLQDSRDYYATYTTGLGKELLGFFAQDFMIGGYRLNQSVSETQKRLDAIDQLRQRHSISWIRLFDMNGQLHDSTLLSDIKEQTPLRRELRPVSELGLGFNVQDLAPADGQAHASVDAAANLLLFAVPVVSAEKVNYGTAVVAVNFKELSQFNERWARTAFGEEFQALDGQHIVVNMAPDAPAGLRAALLEGLAAAKADARYRIQSSDRQAWFVYRSTPKAGATQFLFLVDAKELEFPLYMRIVLLVVVFLTVFLISFLVLNLKQDDMLVLEDRIKRLQISVLQQYVENRGEGSAEHWRQELAARRDEVKRSIKHGLGAKRRNDASVDDLIDKGWDEILAVLGTRAPTAASQFDLSRLEDLVQKVISNYQGQLAALPGTGTARRAPARAVAPALPAEALDEVEEIGEAEAVDEVEEIGEAEAVDEVEEIGEAEAVDEVEEIGEAEALDEVEEINEAEAVDEVEEIGEAEEVGEAEDIAEAEAVDEVEEIGEAEAVEEAEAVAEAEDVGEAEDIAEAEAVEEAEEIEEAEAVDEAEEIAEAEAVEEAEAVDTGAADSENLPFHDRNIPEVVHFDLDNPNLLRKKPLPAQPAAPAVPADEPGELEALEEIAELETLDGEETETEATVETAADIPASELDEAGSVPVEELPQERVSFFSALGASPVLRLADGAVGAAAGKAVPLEDARPLDELQMRCRSGLSLKLLYDYTGVPGQSAWNFKSLDSGVVQIPEEVYSRRPGKVQDQSLGTLVASIIQESGGAEAEPAATIDGLLNFGHAAETIAEAGLGIAAPGEAAAIVPQEQRSFYRSRLESQQTLVLTSKGVNFDAFLRTFRDDESGRIKAMYTFSKRFKAESMILCRIERGGVKVLRTLGLSSECPAWLSYRNGGECLLELLDTPAIALFANKSLLQLIDPPTADYRTLNRSALLPVMVDGRLSFGLLGYSQELPLADFLKNFIDPMPIDPAN